MGNSFQMIFFIIAAVMALTWIYMERRYGHRYDQIIDTIDRSTYRMPEIFFVGFRIMEIIGYDVKSEANRKKVKNMAEIYGKKYAEYYLYVMTGAQISYAVTILPIGILLSVIANEPAALVFGIALAALAVVYLSEEFKDKLNERRSELLMQFPQVLSKMTLLVNSGMVLREAWQKVSMSGTGILYTEMQYTSTELQNGVSEWDAYYAFGERCALKEMKKFAAVVTQGLSKGSSELTIILKDMSDEMWETKRNLVKRKGESSAGKLLGPTAMIFVGILIMIIAPIIGGL